jgi:hypothetical protein
MDVEHFIDRWTGREGGAERANYQMFLSELCDVLGVPRPDPAGATTANNDYVFERAVKRRESESESEAAASTLRIDLYKRGAFILEAKQSRLPGKGKALEGPQAFAGMEEDAPRATGAKWDVLMRNARQQAEDYVFRLPADHAAPPFLIVCDVGRAFEIYADFSGTGRAYGHFPDRKSFRVWIEDLRDKEVRERLACIWTDPESLDPTRKAAKVTREIAKRLAEVSKALEKDRPAEEVAHFLMRCIFTMFAEDVELLPKDSFTGLLQECVEGPESFAPLLEQLWRAMDSAEHDQRFFALFKSYLRHFNGNLFKDARAFPLGRDEIGELLEAARHDWRHVEPAIFGTLLEQALDPAERRRLGAHYTPRSYVERLVEATIMEPLRTDWQRTLKKIGTAKDAGDAKTAIATARAFHHKLCTTRVLDPACGTGNFLYVSLELMKRLEGEVLETMAELGDTESLGIEEVDPHQFLGLELNPRAAAIAELVLWIGYLQQHYRLRSEHPAEPILKAFGNIRQMDAVLTWDGYPMPRIAREDGEVSETYPNPRRPEWPEAEFIVGNPPFIGGKDLRSRMEPGYAEALWKAHKHMNESADFVMYWWDRAAELLARKGTRLRRFGFVTTNSISQVFQRRVMERHLNAKAPVSLVFAIADHPWTKASKDTAAVRIAMTVAVNGAHEGRLREVISEADLDTDDPDIRFANRDGKINSDLTVGVDVTRAKALKANEGLCSPGVKLHGAGFIVTRAEAERLGLEFRPGLAAHLRPYRNGRDLAGRSRDAFVIDLLGLSAEASRQQFPEVYSHLLAAVKPERNRNNRPTYRDNWWIFGEPRRELRPALGGLDRYIVTIETAKHRVFQFLPIGIIPDNKLIVIADEAAATLAILSSRIHCLWAVTAGGWLGYGNDPVYVKSSCFDAFAFPALTEATPRELAQLGEELDATRKAVQAEHPDLTLTGLYNVLEKVRAGAALSEAEAEVKARGRVLILKDLHDQIDRATADAYGWPHDLSDEQILERLVALNAERAAEEAAGYVRWLRPEYQAARFGREKAARSGELDLGEKVVAVDKSQPAFPTDREEQTLAVYDSLNAAGRPMDAAALSRGFKRGGKRIEQRIAQALATLARYGWVVALPNGTYAARRAA